MSNRKTLADIVRSNRLISLAPEVTVAAASAAMATRRRGVVAVIANGALVGIVTERDIIFRVVAQGRDASQVQIVEVMTRIHETLPADARPVEALDMMQTFGSRYIPVVANGKVIGIVTVRELFGEVRRELLEGINDRCEFLFGSGYSVPAELH
ncbi:MAG: CBS domain-containing protein [Rhodospirillaceae bacterium]